jgi:hypothetical protein
MVRFKLLIITPVFVSAGGTKKAGVGKCPQAFAHAGILVNGPLGPAGVPII